MYSENVCQIMIKNADDFWKKKALSKEEAQKFNAEWILKKYPKLKKELMKPDPYLKTQTVAETLAYDRFMWATQNKSWINS